MQPYSEIRNKPTRCLRRQASSDSSLISLGNQTKSLSSPTTKNNSRTSNVLIKTQTSPTFYISSEDQYDLSEEYYSKDTTSNKPNRTYTEIDKMRGTSLRNAGRPANSMEQDSFDSFDDMEDMLVVSATNSLNLNNPNIRYC